MKTSTKVKNAYFCIAFPKDTVYVKHSCTMTVRRVSFIHFYSTSLPTLSLKPDRKKTTCSCQLACWWKLVEHRRSSTKWT